MEFIPYSSEFDQPVDDLLVDSYGIDPVGSFAQAYDLVPDLEQRLESAADVWCSNNHTPSLSELVNQDRLNPRPKHLIQSVVGDDETDTSNSRAFCVLIIVAGPVVSNIKISLKDCGVSKEYGNYAEGNILIPPTIESSFEAVNRRHSRSGVPIVLDGVKLKLISAVRKQSKLELDLESKFTKISETAGWTNRLWFTYDYHQMMLLLAANTFDFRDSRSFPYLFGSEGGCGGMPPYGNLDTGISAIFSFHKGKAKRTIYGIMDETVRCHQGLMRPSDTFFIRSSHIAQLGDKSWALYNDVYRRLLDESSKDTSYVKNLMNLMADKSSLPSDLLEKGVEIAPDNVRVGAAISHLRSDNLLMTELDVKMQLENDKKILALSGHVPYKTILREIEEEKQKFKSNSWTVLGEIARYLPSGYSVSNERLQDLPADLEREISYEIMRSYYTLRTEHYADFTAFSYTDAIRVFKSTDVREYMRKRSNVVRSDIAYQVDPELGQMFSMDIQQERERKERVLSWMSSADLAELLINPLPPGIGPDDSRIIENVMRVFSDYSPMESKKAPLVLLMLTGDRKLVRAVHMYAQTRFADMYYIIYSIEPNQYIGLCLEDCRSADSLNVLYSVIRAGLDVPFWNYIKSAHAPLPSRVMDNIRFTIRHKFSCNAFRCHIEYDFPNLERALEPTTYNPHRNTVSVRNGGFLKVETLSNFSERMSWAHLPLGEIFSWDDFDISKKVRYRITELPSRGVYINAPARPDFFRSISSWQRRVGR